MQSLPFVVSTGTISGPSRFRSTNCVDNGHRSRYCHGTTQSTHGTSKSKGCQESLGKQRSPSPQRDPIRRFVHHSGRRCRGAANLATLSERPTRLSRGPRSWFCIGPAPVV